MPLGLVVLNSDCTRAHSDIINDCIRMIREEIGPVAFFKHCVVVARLPKTRSGKILRSTLRAIGNGEAYSIPATIEDVSVLKDTEDVIREMENREKGN